MRVLEQLNSPLKRAGGIVFAAGVLWFVASVARFYATRYYYESLGEEWWKAIVVDDFSYWYLAAATYLAVFGLLISFAYDYTLGAVVKWIRGASDRTG